MLLHELGHVLGIGHLEKTIMSEGIAKLTVKMPDPLSEDMAQAALSRIDRQRELVLCTDCTYLSRSKWPGEWSEAEESLFLRIFGRLPAGDYRLGARIVGNKQGLLVLRDQLGEMSAIVLEMVGKPVLLGRTFKTYWTEKAEPTASQKARGMEAPFLGLDIEGVVLGMHGERIGVRILHNLGSAPLEVLIKRGESPALSWYTARLP